MISFQEILELHELSIIDFGGSHGIRDIDMLQSAVERPSATFDSTELYTTPIQKAAAIFESIIKNHPFVDGNKRTAWLACFTMLRLYEYKLFVSQTDAYNFVIEVASSHMEFDNIVEWIEQHATKI
jgi:death-on-curing protein